MPIVLLVKLCEPLFSNHSTVPPLNAVAKISRSPSPSTSLIANPNAPFKFPTMDLSVKFSDPSFSYQLISSPSIAVATTSISPSKSRSTISRPNAPLRLLSSVAELKVDRSLVIAVGFTLPSVADPPDIDRVKSPVSRAPVPPLVS